MRVRRKTAATKSEIMPIIIGSSIARRKNGNIQPYTVEPIFHKVECTISCRISVQCIVKEVENRSEIGEIVHTVRCNFFATQSLRCPVNFLLTNYTPCHVQKVFDLRTIDVCRNDVCHALNGIMLTVTLYVTLSLAVGRFVYLCCPLQAETILIHRAEGPS